jgi:hypothetical protein
VSVFSVRPIHDFVFIDIIDRNVTTKDLGGGKVIHLLSDDTFGTGPHDSMHSRHPGIRPRWARVIAVGPEAEDDVEVGDLILCDTLKWGHGIPLGRDQLRQVQFWRINVKDILLVDKHDAARADYLNQFQALLDRIELTIGHL